MERRGEEVHITTEEARAGSTEHVVRYVLAISLALAVAALAVVWLTNAVDRPWLRGQAEPIATAPA